MAGSVKCTCQYRAATETERIEGGMALILNVLDPFCPAMENHERFLVIEAGKRE